MHVSHRVMRRGIAVRPALWPSDVYKLDVMSTQLGSSCIPHLGYLYSTVRELSDCPIGCGTTLLSKVHWSHYHTQTSTRLLQKL
jgi:hypothetical protein